MERIPLTSNGLKNMEEELKHLKQVERPRIIQSLEEAKEHGDLSENAEYHAARERQSFTEGRIMELEDKISRAQVIDVRSLSGETVKFGATLDLQDQDSQEVLHYQIVGAEEADIKRGLLSITSPLARSAIGKSPNDIIELDTPRGEKSYKILSVKFI